MRSNSSIRRTLLAFAKAYLQQPPHLISSHYSPKLRATHHLSKPFGGRLPYLRLYSFTASANVLL